MEASLYSLRVPSGHGDGAGSDVNTSHVFPQGVLGTTTLVGGGVGDGGIGPEPAVCWSFLLAQWLSPPYQGQDRVPSTLATEGSDGRARGAGRALGIGLGAGCDSQTPRLLLMCCLCKGQ